MVGDDYIRGVPELLWEDVWGEDIKTKFVYKYSLEWYNSYKWSIKCTYLAMENVKNIAFCIEFAFQISFG